MDLGVAVVSYNTRDLTADCLTSILRCLEADALKGQLWVLDNASPDGSAEMIAQRFPRVSLIASEENLGFAAGTNHILERILSAEEPPRHILLLNPDTVVHEGALGAMVSFLDEHPDVGIVGPQLEYADGSFQHAAFRFPTLWMALFDFWPIHHRVLNSRLNGRYSRRRYSRGEPFPIDHPLGAALLARRAVFDRIGLLDAGFFMYCEEIDWCMRASDAGWRIYCVPAARITHLEGQSARQFRHEMFVALWKSRFRLFRKHYGRLYEALARLIVHLGLWRLARQTRTAFERGELGEEELQQRLRAYDQVRAL